jgi:hypothetical protein
MRGSRASNVEWKALPRGERGGHDRGARVQDRCADRVICADLTMCAEPNAIRRLAAIHGGSCGPALAIRRDAA